MDPESRAWVADLAGEGGDREAALDRLHALLLRGPVRAGPTPGPVPGLSAAERHDLAVQAADDAMMGVLARLGDFRRGLSRFTTWAQVRLLEAATKACRMAWWAQLPRPFEDWAAWPTTAAVEAAAEHAELLAALRAAVAEVLTPSSGEVLLTVVAGRAAGRAGRAARHHPGRPLQDDPRRAASRRPPTRPAAGGEGGEPR